MFFHVQMIATAHGISLLEFREKVKNKVHILYFSIVNRMTEIFYRRETSCNANVRARVGEGAGANLFFELLKREEWRQRKADKNGFNIFFADEREQSRKF